MLKHSSPPLPKYKDLYPLKYKNFINSKIEKHRAILIIQKAWRKYIINKNMKEVPSRFHNWFLF